jgi:sugar-specific transcriptional regulator TrmB
MTRLGISETEAKIYRALLERRELSALEIHELTKVPRTKVYEITQKMILRGMCIEKQMGRKKKYQAVEPQRAFDNLLGEYEMQLDEKKAIAKTICETVCPIYIRGMKHANMSEYVEIIKDLPSIHERYVSLVKNTRKELVGFVKPPFAYQDRTQKLKEQEKAELSILKKGAIIRVLYEFPGKDNLDDLIEHIKMCIRAGERARVIEEVPIKMYIFDARHVLMALDNVREATSPLTMLVVEHPALAQAVKLLFNHLWEQAHDYKILESMRTH